MPLLTRVLKYHKKNDQTDSCCAIFAKKPEENDEMEGECEAGTEDEEKGTEDKEKGTEVRSVWRREACCWLA